MQKIVSIFQTYQFIFANIFIACTKLDVRYFPSTIYLMYYVEANNKELLTS